MLDHYPDMNHDGKVDIYDVATFHELVDEDEHENQERHTTTGNYSGSSGAGAMKTILIVLAIWGFLKLLVALVS